AHHLHRSFVQQQLGHGVLQLPVFLLQLSRRRAWLTSIPPYFAFHRYRLPRVIPCRRHSSSGAIPASASFRMAMICSSLKRLLRTTPPLGPERAIVNGEVTFPLDYFSGGRSSTRRKKAIIAFLQRGTFFWRRLSR